jgi:alkylhydroperoxidase/carboxymuconolactone decarboxylase family protein YurZ
MEKRMDITKFSIKQALNQLETEKSEYDLSAREKHLVGLAVTLTRGCQDCSSRRIGEAVKAGIEYVAIEKLVDLVAAVNAGVVLRTAVESASRDDAEAACSDGICDIGTR